MELQKIGVKVFATAPNEIPLTDFIDIFHSWIQASDGVYHDVADYSHMQAGPGIVLVANDANVSIDEVDHRRGLLYSQKAHLDGSNQEKIRTVFRAAFDNCRRLEQEPLLRGKLKFLTNDLVFFVNDRFLAPNTEDTLTKLKPELETALGGLFGERNFALERNLNARQRFSVAVRTSESSIRTS